LRTNLNIKFKYGKKIFDKIIDASKPEYDDEIAIEAFDFWKGANFKLKAKNVAGYRNYDSSEFGPMSPLRPDNDSSVSDEMNDIALEQIWKKEYSLQELISPDKFKTYDELKKRLDSVLGNTSGSRQASSFEDEDDSLYGQSISNSSSIREETSQYTTQTEKSFYEDDDDDTLSYFQRLAEE
jgi:gp32 DNA binding protein like